MFRAITIKIN